MNEEIKAEVARQVREERVRLLSPKPGDVVVFQLAGPIDMQQLNYFYEDLKPFIERHPGVQFMAGERIEDVLVVRPQAPPRVRVSDEVISRNDWKGV